MSCGLIPPRPTSGARSAPGDEADDDRDEPAPDGRFAARVGPVGFDRHRHQPGDRRRHFPDPCRAGRRGGRLGTDCLPARRLHLAAGRVVLRGSGQPLRQHGRTLSLHARRVRPAGRLRSRLDAVVHPRHQPGVERQRHRPGARVLLAGDDERRGPHHPAGRPHRHACRDQHPRHPPKRVGGERADDRQAGTARHLHRGRLLRRRSRAAVAAARRETGARRRRARCF